MLHAEETEDILPDLQHLSNRMRKRVEKILKEFKDLFKTVVSSRGASVTPFELKVNERGWINPETTGVQDE